MTSPRHAQRSIVSVLLISLLGLAMAGAPPAGAATYQGGVYFMLGDNGSEPVPGPRLVPVARPLDTVTPATTAMQALIAGPTGGEAASVPGVSSAVPAATRLLGIGVTGGIATVDLSGEFVSGGGTLSMTARLAQVVFTLTQFSTVDGVRFEIDGVPTTVFGGEGIVVDDPATRHGFMDLAPSILLESPAYGGAVGNPARLVGTANTFEAVFRVAVVDGDGRIVAEEWVMASAGSGTWGTFDVTIPYDTPDSGIGAVVTWYDSPADGSRTDIREYPVGLTRGAWCRGVPATIIGTWSDDILRGTPGRDVIVALDGHDRVFAGGGADLVCAGAGNDRVYGGPRRDTILGERGNDRLWGGDGKDRLLGGWGVDTADGQSGSDRCVAETEVSCP